MFSMGMLAGGLISIHSGSCAVIGYSQVDILLCLCERICSVHAFEIIVESVEGLGSKWTHENFLEGYQ